MNIFFYIFSALFFTQALLAKEFVLSSAKAEYTIKHLLKTVKGESKDLKGKMICKNKNCEFLIAVDSKSFISSDSNRDLNMQTILEVTRFPWITIKGSFQELELGKEVFKIKSKVLFHGVEKEYLMKISKGTPSSGQFILNLEDHKIERPSLLMAKIENEVPIQFQFEWK